MKPAPDKRRNRVGPTFQSVNRGPAEDYDRLESRSHKDYAGKAAITFNLTNPFSGLEPDADVLRFGEKPQRLRGLDSVLHVPLIAIGNVGIHFARCRVNVVDVFAADRRCSS
jgi:hypothetical protein